MAPPSTNAARRAAWAVALAAGLATASFATSALAGPKDNQAKKALTSAMEEDYLGTEFEKAEKKLRAAIDACGDNGCAVPIKAKLYVALGTVLAGGKKQLDDAKDAFIEALKLDKNAAIDPDWASTEINYAFEQARAEMKLGPKPGPKPAVKPVSADGLTHTPVAEQKVDTPVPIWVELSSDLAGKTKKVTVSYRGPGETEWRSLIMKKIKDGAYGINVPCTAITSEGSLKYAITVEGDEGEVLATAGSRTDPLITPIKKTLDGDPPHWPDHAPPESCAPVEKGPEQCVDDTQCNAGLVCKAGQCREKQEGAEGDAKSSEKTRKNWFSLAFVPDVAVVSGDRVCTKEGQQNDNFVCFRSDGSRYLGTPETEGEAIGNNVNTGPALATLRIVVGYDRLILDNLTIGVRAGFAFNGAPKGADFLPLHAEGRIAYYIGKQPFADRGARPFVFLAGGLAQVDARISPVQVLEDGEACGADPPESRSAECTEESPGDDRIEPRIQDLDVYKQAGFGWVGGGAGISFAPIPSLSLNLAVRASVTLPVALFVLSPEAGLSLGF